jgi:hypothetical protein
MNTRDLPDWDTFQEEIQALRATYERPTFPLLFRGVSDSTFPLTTTLERAGCKDMFFSEFYRLVSRAGPAIETFTGVQWNVPEYSIEMELSFKDINTFSDNNFPSRELYPFLVYLRHHGFPSPLLDWSRSPYVAAFFAFRNLILNPSLRHAEKSSIYVYCEMPLKHKGGAVGEPMMRAIGPYVRSHRRHFRQQSDYTICTSFEKAGWRFHEHGPVFGGRLGRQDALWKFDLPSSRGISILESLDQYNLNAFSLFDSEETLLETVWFREQVVRYLPAQE